MRILLCGSNLCEFHYDEVSFQFFSEGVFAEVDGAVCENAVQAEVFSFEYCGFGFALYFANAIDGFLRHDKVTRYKNGYRIQSDGMCNRANACPVIAKLRKVAVAAKFHGSFVFISASGLPASCASASFGFASAFGHSAAWVSSQSFLQTLF